MSEADAAPRALLFDGSGRVRLTVGERTFEDVPIVPLDENAPEPADITVPALMLRPSFPTGVALVPGHRVENVALYHAQFKDDGSMDEVRVRVRDVRERKVKGDPFWNRVFRKKS